MVQSHALLLVAALAAASATPSQTADISGRLVAISASTEGTSIQVDVAGVTRSVAVSPDAVVQERAAGGSWARVSLSGLKSMEPVRVRRDASGRAIEIDAEFVVIDTQAVIVRHDYLIGTDGVARRLVGAAATVAAIPLGAYVQLRADPATGDAFDAAVSSRPFVPANAGPAVRVTFDVQVPANTPPDAIVYIATNQQRWIANAVRLSPEPGNRWSVTLPLPGGTTLQYKYTRGSWSTGERDAAGADIPNRTLLVKAGVKTQAVEDVVARWADLPS